jgi:hypothetical protein
MEAAHYSNLTITPFNQQAKMKVHRKIAYARNNTIESKLPQR